MLLLPQLVKIWLPDYSTGNDPSPPSEQAPESQIPPLVSFFEALPNVSLADNTKGKRFPCSHVVSIRSLLACGNYFGEATWTPGPHFLSCAQSECEYALEFPKLPDPRVVDGLKMRLDLIEWSFNKDAPTELDRSKVSLLRDILSRLGHSDRDSELDVDGNLSPNKPSESSITQTLVHMELEAYDLMVLKRRKKAEITLRGGEPYCAYRDFIVPTTRHSQLLYPMRSPGQHCECVPPHEFERKAGAWALTPAETEDERTDEKSRKRKTVRFVAPVVTEVRYFEPWWCDEYRDSGRYWSTGPHRRSTDLSTPADDEWVIERLDDPEGLEARIVRDLESEGSACGAVVDGDDNDDDELLKEIEKAFEDDEASGKIEGADEPCDDDKVLDEIEKANESWESWDDETLDGSEDGDESWEGEKI